MASGTGHLDVVLKENMKMKGRQPHTIVALLALGAVQTVVVVMVWLQAGGAGKGER